MLLARKEAWRTKDFTRQFRGGITFGSDHLESPSLLSLFRVSVSPDAVHLGKNENTLIARYRVSRKRTPRDTT